jgi:putative salt-induced outer membrane protein
VRRVFLPLSLTLIALPAHAQDVPDDDIQIVPVELPPPPIIVVPVEQFLPPATPVASAHMPPGKIKRPMPDRARQTLDAALATNNEGEVNTVVKYLRRSYPDHQGEFTRIAGDWKRAREEAAIRRLQESDFWELAKGKIEVGGFQTTGNTNNTGVHGVIDLAREGFSWRHKWRLNAEYQESFGNTTRERYVASYEPNYKIDDRLFIFGTALYENDRFAGYHARYSAATGAGYTAIREGGKVLNVSLGPAFRHTDFTTKPTESDMAARGSIEFDWRLSPTITFDQDASFYLQAANSSTVTSTTAVRARLFGPIQGQLSYLVNYESMPPIGRKSVDTTSRASVVYAF